MDAEERELELTRMQEKIDEDKQQVQDQLEQMKMKERVMSSLKVKFDKEKAEMDNKHAQDLAEINAAAM